MILKKKEKLLSKLCCQAIWSFCINKPKFERLKTESSFNRFQKKSQNLLFSTPLKILIWKRLKDEEVFKSSYLADLYPRFKSLDDAICLGILYPFINCRNCLQQSNVLFDRLCKHHFPIKIFKGDEKIKFCSTLRMMTDRATHRHLN